MIGWGRWSTWNCARHLNLIICTKRWYMHKREPFLEKGTHKIFWDFEILTDYQIPTRRPNLVIVNKRKKKKEKRKRTCWIVDFAVPVDHREKIKENEKRGKHLDLSREFKKLWNMKGMVIPIGALGTIPKGLVRRLEDLDIGRRAEAIQTTALLRSARILRRVLETWGDWLSLRLQRNTIS